MSEVQIPDKWSHLPFFQEDFQTIQAALARDQRNILPPADQRFTALALTPPQTVSVVILGQDPYPTAGHAHGLSFSVAPDVHPLPRSLNNIFKEMQDDIGTCPQNGDLRFWARQGVLMLNTSLSVPEGDANGHKNLGWQTLADQILTEISRRPTAFVLWGKQAQALAPRISSPKDGAQHLMIQTAHPSPLSARRGFFGSKPFSRINTWLAAQRRPPINWTDA